MALADRVANVTAFYPLDEASGNALESIGSLTATDNNTVGAGSTGFTTISAGRDFELSNSEYFNRADNSAFAGGDTDWSIRCIVNFESLTDYRCIASQWSSFAGGQRGWALMYYAGTNRISLWVSSDGSNWDGVRDANNLGAPSTATPYLIVAGHDSVNNQLFIQVNGGTRNTGAWSAGVHNSTADLRIGLEPNNLYYMDGIVAELTFLNCVMSSAEHIEDYNSGDPVPFADWGGGGAATSLITSRQRHRQRQNSLVRM